MSTVNGVPRPGGYHVTKKELSKLMRRGTPDVQPCHNEFNVFLQCLSTASGDESKCQDEYKILQRCSVVDMSPSMRQYHKNLERRVIYGLLAVTRTK